MHKNLAAIALTACSFLLLSCPLTQAQSSSAPQDPDKRALIDDLLVTKRSTQSAEFGFNLMMDQEIKSFSSALRDRLDAPSANTPPKTEEQKKTIIAALDTELERYRALLLQEVDFKKIINDVFATLYDKYYTTDEIKEQLAFYKSKLGQKTLDVTPKLTEEAVTLINAQTKDGIKRAMEILRTEMNAKGKNTDTSEKQAAPASK
jgi:hypothetical protein